MSLWSVGEPSFSLVTDDENGVTKKLSMRPHLHQTVQIQLSACLSLNKNNQHISSFKYLSHKNKELNLVFNLKLGFVEVFLLL